MARKRSSRTPGGSSNPNAVLVVFLVLFILATLGLGGWVYSIFGERHKWEGQAKAAEAKVASARKAEDWAVLQAYELRNMVGDASIQDDNSTEVIRWRTLRDEFLNDAEGALKIKEGTRFNEEKDKDNFFKIVETGRKDLGWNAQTKRYKATFAARIKTVQDEALKERTTAFAEQTKRLTWENKERSRDALFETVRKEQMTKIEEGNTATLKAASAATDLMTLQIKKNTDLLEDLNKANQKYVADTTILKAKITDLSEQVRAAGGTMPGEKAGKGPKGAGRPVVMAQAHALLLDISKGKPLWDRPRGKIVRIDEKSRRVYIDQGVRDGVKPGLTFNVFGAGWGGRAEGPFKGTIEVVSVESATSVARITSLYDEQGNEISLNDPSPSKIIRGGSNPWKDGDLIFNLVWGTHIAVAGAVDFSGRGAEATASQQDELKEFLRAAESQGVTVDAYVDLRDGKLRGALTPRTAYLVVGAKGWGGGKGPDATRTKAVNETVTDLTRQAVERGLFQISPDNFLNVVGYRRPRSKMDTELSHFRPGMPVGGVTLEGVAAGEGMDGGAAELTGRWGGKMAGGGQLHLTFKGDGGCFWQLVVGMDTLKGFTNVVRAGNEYRASIQNRQVTMRFVGGAQALQVTGPNTDATLTKE